MYIASPIITHNKKYKDESPPEMLLYIIKQLHIIIPSIGNNGQNGTLKGLCLFGSVFLSINTSIQIITNEANVP